MVTDKLQVSNSGTDIFVQGIFFPAILSARYPKNCQDISSFLIGIIAPSLSGEDGRISSETFLSLDRMDEPKVRYDDRDRKTLSLLEGLAIL